MKWCRGKSRTKEPQAVCNVVDVCGYSTYIRARAHTHTQNVCGYNTYAHAQNHNCLMSLANELQAALKRRTSTHAHSS